MVGEGQGLDGTCAIPLPGVQTHHEIRAGTLGRCLPTGWGRPKVGTGLDIEPPGRRPTCAPPDGLGLVRHPCFFPACTYWPALHGGKPAEGGERRWKWERSRRARRENRRRTLHCCQVTGGGEAEEQDDGGQRGEASHNSDSDHPVRTCSTGVFHPHAHC